jgi:hypothetical protein
MNTLKDTLKSVINQHINMLNYYLTGNFLDQLLDVALQLSDFF